MMLHRIELDLIILFELQLVEALQRFAVVCESRKIIFSVRRAGLDSLILLVSLANMNEKVLTDIPKNCLFEFERKSFNWMQSYTKAVKVYIESESSRRLFNHVCEESCHLI